MSNDDAMQATLNAWQAQLAQVNQRKLERGNGQAGLARPEQVKGKTGLEIMTALLEGDLPHPYMADTFGCDLVELGDGLAIFQATQVNLNIVRAAHTKTGPLRCIGTAIHVGRQVGTSEARIVGPDGKLYAHGTTTCAIFEAR